MIRLRPLSGHEEEIVGIYWELNLENLAPATFPLPTADSIKDHTAAVLLMDAARHLLRSGAVPFRCLGRRTGCNLPITNYLKCQNQDNQD
jgi:hypothetical protein